MIVDAASWPSRADHPTPARWEVALIALALTISGVVGLTLLFAGPSTYAEIALAPGRGTATFRVVDETAGGPLVLGRMTMSPGALIELHRGWLAYVTGRSQDQPAGPVEFFTRRERAHMADVRNVFIAAQLAAVLVAVAALWLAARGWRRGALARLIRAGAVSALVAVAVVAVLAAVAFDAAFLLFHQVFFPQGNFLFEPGSNLLALYPESYFYGVTLRIGASFVGLAALLAAVSHVAVRRRSASA